MGDFGCDDQTEFHTGRGQRAPNDRRVDSLLGYAESRTRQGNERANTFHFCLS